MNEAKKNQIRAIFKSAPFVVDLGVEIEKLEPKICHTRMKILPKHLQQTGVVHAGVLATIADHSAGGSAGTALADDEFILTVSFKIDLFKAAKGPELKCISQVLKKGRSLAFCESEVFDCSGDKETLVAKASITLAVLKKRES